MQCRLSELNPSWYLIDGVDAGMEFDCPACPRRIGGAAACLIRVQWAQPWRKNQFLWEKKGDSVKNLTLNPSIDGSLNGCRFAGWVMAGIVYW